MPGFRHLIPAPTSLRHLASPLLVACVALLSACTTPTTQVSGPFNEVPAPDAPAPTAQQKAAQEELVKMVALQDRLSKVSAPLLINNADLCKTYARNLLGFTAQNKYSYPGVYADAAQAALGYGEQMQVSGVLPGSGAARAGYDIGNAASFWQRIATQVPAGTANGYTALHPGMSARIAAINRAVIDVRAKQSAKKPLRP